MCGSRRFAESDQTMIGVAYFFESWNNEGARRRLERRGGAFMACLKARLQGHRQYCCDFWRRI